MDDRERMKELVMELLNDLVCGEMNKNDVVERVDEMVGALLDGTFEEAFRT